MKLPEIFAGMQEAFGTYEVDETQVRADGKKKGSAVTYRQPVTLDHWNTHIAGSQRLGIIPIRSDNLCTWGCIDIDQYKGFDVRKLLPQVNPWGLWTFRSKSGGAHVVAFVTPAITASEMQNKLREVAAAIGHGQAEIFPKQTSVDLNSGAMANWLNMPYFGGNGSLCYAYDDDGEALTLDEFEELSEPMPSEEFLAMQVTPPTKEGDEFAEAPPCLQALVRSGFPQGSRNRGLFNLAIYRKKSEPDAWETRIPEDNSKYMSPGSNTEVQNIIKGLRKKEYAYVCDQAPIAAVCNRAVCMTRAHGIGRSEVSLTGLQKLAMDEPIWYLDVNGSTVELTTNQLNNQAKFQEACMEQLSVRPPARKQEDWGKILSVLLEEVVTIEVPPEASGRGAMEEATYSWLTDVHHGRAWEDLFLGTPYTEGGHTYFRLNDLVTYLRRNGFKDVKRNWVTSRLREMQATHGRKRVGNRVVNYWSLEALPKITLRDPDKQQEAPF